MKLLLRGESIIELPVESVDADREAHVTNVGSIRILVLIHLSEASRRLVPSAGMQTSLPFPFDDSAITPLS